MKVCKENKPPLSSLFRLREASAMMDGNVSKPEQSCDTSEESSSSTESNNAPLLLASVCRDSTVLAQVSNGDRAIVKAGERLLRKDPKPSYDYYTFGIQSRHVKRKVQGVKFHVYEQIPMKHGECATLQGLENQAQLNGKLVTIIEYMPSTQKYLIELRAPSKEQISATGMLVVHCKHLLPESNSSSRLRVWTFSAIYDGKQMEARTACQFLEKIVMLAQAFLPQWADERCSSCQDTFGPILEAQMENFQGNTDCLCLDETMDFSKLVIESNVALLRAAGVEVEPSLEWNSFMRSSSSKHLPSCCPPRPDRGMKYLV